MPLNLQTLHSGKMKFIYRIWFAMLQIFSDADPNSLGARKRRRLRNRRPMHKSVAFILSSADVADPPGVRPKKLTLEQAMEDHDIQDIRQMVSDKTMKF